MSDEENNDIIYEVKGLVAIITLNIPKSLNALNGEQYLALGKAIDEADKDEETVVTIIQSTGRFFSAGANISDKKTAELDPAELFSHRYWMGAFVGRNTWLTELFTNHSKVLVTALNGPVIGLSAALVLLTDLIYVKNESDVYILTPFSNLGLAAEGGSSVTLFQRLGWSKAAEALLFAKKITGAELNRAGLINKAYNDPNLSVEDFNNKVHDDVLAQFENLYHPSVLANKQLLNQNRADIVRNASNQEVRLGLDRFVNGVPQGRFVALANGDIKHKM